MHAFGDDVLGDLDGLALAQRIRDREVTRREVVEAALARLAKVDGLHATQLVDERRALAAPAVPGPFSGVPTFVKDNVDVEGWATGMGSEAFVPKPAKRTSVAARTVLSTGLVALGKSRLPEIGLNASTEFQTGEPVRNPWDPAYSAGASSGGAAALVASGVVPIAHANDGGGSIRIPAAANGLVGLKPTRGRWAPDPLDRVMPVRLVSNGCVSRTVRDTATFHAALERHWRNPALPPLGLVDGPARRRLRVAMIMESVTDAVVDTPTKAAVERTATLLEEQGHSVEPVPIPVDARFGDDFLSYWGLLAFLAGNLGRLTIDRTLDTARLDGLTDGLDTSGDSSDDSSGRFVACRKGFYDPAVFQQGREVTFIGKISGTESARIGEYDYRLPKIDADVIYLWPVVREVRVVDPWGPWGPWGPGPYWGPYWGPRWGWW